MHSGGAYSTKCILTKSFWGGLFDKMHSGGAYLTKIHFDKNQIILGGYLTKCKSPDLGGVLVFH